jgi:hypothetical protein
MGDRQQPMTERGTRKSPSRFIGIPPSAGPTNRLDLSPVFSAFCALTRLILIVAGH